jgi:hypothetical protein
MLLKFLKIIQTGDAEGVSNEMYAGVTWLCQSKHQAVSSLNLSRMAHGCVIIAEELKAAMIRANTCGIIHSHESN